MNDIALAFFKKKSTVAVGSNPDSSQSYFLSVANKHIVLVFFITACGSKGNKIRKIHITCFLGKDPYNIITPNLNALCSCIAYRKKKTVFLPFISTLPFKHIYYEFIGNQKLNRVIARGYIRVDEESSVINESFVHEFWCVYLCIFLIKIHRVPPTSSHALELHLHYTYGQMLTQPSKGQSHSLFKIFKLHPNFKQMHQS
jgi:hypothetical protein